MSNVRVEHYQPQSSQDLARQRLAASRQEILLYTHLLQASLVVERSNPLRQAAITHPQLVRNTMVTIVILLSAIAGILASLAARTSSLRRHTVRRFLEFPRRAAAPGFDDAAAAGGCGARRTRPLGPVEPSTRVVALPLLRPESPPGGPARIRRRSP